MKAEALLYKVLRQEEEEGPIPGALLLIVGLMGYLAVKRLVRKVLNG